MNPLKDLVPTGTVWMPPRTWDGVKWNVYTCRFDEYDVSWDSFKGVLIVRYSDWSSSYFFGSEWDWQHVIDVYTKVIIFFDTVKEFRDE